MPCALRTEITGGTATERRQSGPPFVRWVKSKAAVTRTRACGDVMRKLSFAELKDDHHMLYARLARYAATALILLTAVHGAISHGQPGDTPGSHAVSEPWSTPPSAVTDEQQRDFNDGPTHLSGTLYYPRGAHKVPAVVALHGASSPTRDLPLYRHLRELLPPLGIAVFVFDRRGSGKSDSSSDSDDFDLLAADGIALIAAAFPA